MYRAIVTLRGTSSYSCSHQHRLPFKDGESHEDYEKRTWREKANHDPKTGIVYIPAMAFKQAMDSAAKRLAIPDPDNRKVTFTKYFLSDVICEQNLSIGISKDKMPKQIINANVNGKRGSGSRVERMFPQTPNWEGQTSFLVMEEKVNKDIFKRVLTTAGTSIGVGQFRAENGGLNGRFEIARIKFEQIG